MISTHSAFARDLQYPYPPELSAVIPYDAVAAALGKACSKAGQYYGTKSAIGEACSKAIRARLSGRSRVHAGVSKPFEARPGPERRARMAEPAGQRATGARARHARVNEMLHHIRHAIGKAASVAGRARTHARRRVSSLHALAQKMPQRLRESFRQRRDASGAMKSPASQAPRGAVSSAASSAAKYSNSIKSSSDQNDPAAMKLDTPSGMTTAFRLTLQDAMKNSAATESFKDDGMTLNNLAACLGGQSRRPLRSLVTGMKMALQTALPDDVSGPGSDTAEVQTQPHSRPLPQSQALPASPLSSAVTRFDPMRAMLRKDPGMEARFAGLLREFPLVESVYARLTPWGNGDDLDKKLAGVADDAAALYCSPPDYLLMRYSRPLSDDIQYSRRFLQAFDTMLATVPQGA